jgi:hypothetical protein
MIFPILAQYFHHPEVSSLIVTTEVYCSSKKLPCQMYLLTYLSSAAGIPHFIIAGLFLLRLGNFIKVQNL